MQHAFTQPYQSHAGKPQEGDVAERPLGELISQLSQDASSLLKQEVALAKEELADKAKRAQRQATAIAAGLLVLYAGALLLTAALVLLLAQVIAPWLSALLVGAAVTAGGAVLLFRGKNSLQKLDPTPQHSIASVQHDIDAVKEAVHGD